MSQADSLQEQNISVPSTSIPYHTLYLPQTDSTNNECRRLAATGNISHGTLLYTSYQTAGRGQGSHVWESRKGQNLLFTLYLTPVFLPANQQFFLSEIASLATAQTLDSIHKGFCVKWPNDVYYQEKKIAGMLLESVIHGTHLANTLIGIGININQNHFESDAPNPISLKQLTGKDTPILPVLEIWMQKFDNLYHLLQRGHKDTIHSLYRNRLFRKDGYHPYSDKNGRFLARILDVEPSGFLHLEDQEGTLRRYAFKEVKFILP